VTETQRILEWLVRVADQVHEIKSRYDAEGVSEQELLDFIRKNYETLSVMTKVASGTAYMSGITPPKEM
jgi:hypothetical protein